jgi:UDP-GlcNAc:undecaprenyl-phosphate/decaprenyl-phosphate GlcNAc-1-phosphate transferase
MSPELNAAAAFAIAALTTYLVTPVAIRIAVRTHFFDLPAGYKGHRSPTPYLGGTAIIIGILAGVVAVRGAADAHWAIIVGALGIWAVGTLDDRVSLPISLRTLIEVSLAVLLWATGRGWDVFGFAPADLALTVVWVVGIMNAFNLMDNMDGASATCAAVSAVGAGSLALISGDYALAPLAFAVAGAAFGFLPRNLARPARIFMGDGGSLLLGFLVARVTMAAVTRSYLGPSGVIVAALLVSLVIFDTTLVTISRSRAGQPVLTGGRDHLTHRLVRKLGTPRHVALSLALTQLVVCGLTIAVAQAGVGWVLLAGAAMAVVGGVLIWQLETVPVFRREAPTAVAAPGQAGVVEPTVAEAAEIPAATATAAAQIAQ